MLVFYISWLEVLVKCNIKPPILYFFLNSIITRAKHNILGNKQLIILYKQVESMLKGAQT